ncbi:MAG: copper resistance protein CopC [Actinomycetales bacterium]|nr:copper resistance protein CopC [Actinomycetales bacterium]
MRSRLLTVLAGTALALGVAAAPAAAHDTLLASDPADGAVLGEPPTAITLEFSGELLDLNPALELTTSDGTPVEVGEAHLDGPTASWTITEPESLAAGDYEVVWAVTSSDGHPIDGTFAFTVEGAAAPESPEPTTTEPTTTEPTTTPEPTTPEPTATDPAQTDPDPSVTEVELTATAEPQDPSDISRTAETWFFAGLAVSVLVVIGIVVAVRRGGRDPNGPPGQH